MYISSSTLTSTNYSKEIQKLLEALDKSEVKEKASTPQEAVQQAKKESIGELLNSLLKNVAKDEGLKQSLLTSLKNSTLPKSIQNTSSELKSLVEVIKTEPTLQKFVSKIENSLVQIQNITPKNLQSQVQNSGVFYEAALKESIEPNKQIPKTLIENLAKVESNLKEVQPLSSDKPQQALNSIKEFVNALKEDKNLSNALLKDIKSVLGQLSKNLSIDTSSSKQLGRIEYALNISSSPKSIQAFTNMQNALMENTNELLHVKKLQALTNLVSAIKESPKVTLQEVLEPLKTVIENIKTLPSPSKELSQNIIKLESSLDKLALQESKLQNSSISKEVQNPKEIQVSKESQVKVEPPVIQKEIQKFETEVKAQLSELKTSFEQVAKSNVLPQKSVDTITKMIDTLLLQTKLFKSEQTPLMQTQGLNAQTLKPQSTNLSIPLEVSTKLQTLVNLIKSELANSNPKLSLHVDLQKSVEVLEKSLQKELPKLNLQALKQEDIPLKDKFSADVKAVLSSLKEELSSMQTPKAKQMLLHVDKALNNIEYYQLNSYLANSSQSYLPYLWEGLEKGEISFKKLKENRFFCEIDIELKEYGRIDLMLMLFGDNNVDINLFTQSKEFLTLFRENIRELRVGLNELGLVPHNIQMYDALKSEKQRKATHSFVEEMQMDMGVNIKV